MKSTFKILFYARKNYVTKNGEIGIMARISLNGQKTQFSSKLMVPPDKQGSFHPPRISAGHQLRV